MSGPREFLSENIKRGPKPKILDTNTIRELLHARFSVPEIAGMAGVSVSTIRRRMKTENISVRDTYTNISDQDLHDVIAEILLKAPSTGSKIMKGFLFSRGIRVTEQRLREAMRFVDPVGVEIRRQAHRAITRRTYSVPHSLAMYHLDTNMKLVRYRIIVKSCIDGKSRFCVYIDAANNNTALSSFESFMNGVRLTGCPSRARSDKGGENVLIARFMITARGVDRGSHITGRSVHNQRIERFWVNVNRITENFYRVFQDLEEAGQLDVDNEDHLYILHYVFMPRVQATLNEFRQAWNDHPVSTERNYSPNQLMLLYLDPSEPTQISQDVLEQIYEDCKSSHQENVDENDPVRQPQPVRHAMSPAAIARLHGIDPMRPSEYEGKDIYAECLSSVIMPQ